METATLPTDWSKINDALTENEPRYAMDSRLYVQFYSRPMLHAVKSAEAGRPIYIDVDHVRIMVPGDKLSIVDRIASPDDRQRFQDHYTKYKAGQAQQMSGTPLETLPWMSRSRVEEYKFFGIHTLEQLSDANDEVGTKFPGFYGDKEKAKKYIEAATGTNARVADLERELAELKAKLSAAPAAPQQKGPEKVAAKG